MSFLVRVTKVCDFDLDLVFVRDFDSDLVRPVSETDLEIDAVFFDRV